MAMRMAVMALRNAAAARMNTSSAIRLTHSRRSLRVMKVGRSQVLSFCSKCKTARTAPETLFIRGLLLQWRSRIVRQLVLAGVRALHFQLIKEQRRTNDSCGHAADAVADERVVADGDEIAPQGAHVELIEHGAADQFLMAIRVNAIQKTRRIAGAECIDAISIGLALLVDHLQYFFLELLRRLRFGALQEQHAETRRREGAGSRASVTIRSRKVSHRLAAHQIIVEHPVLDDVNGLGLHAFVVHVIA